MISMRALNCSKRLNAYFTLTDGNTVIQSTITKLRVLLSVLVRYHVKQELTEVLLSAFHGTPVSVPITDS